VSHRAYPSRYFRPEDWFHYQQVNRRFADAVLKENGRHRIPMLLAQDYPHFALLPRMIKEARPDARVAIFWHIPWPNAKLRQSARWQRELVDGLLGADLIGFHIQCIATIFWKQWIALSERSRMGPVRREPSGPCHARSPVPHQCGLPGNGA